MKNPFEPPRRRDLPPGHLEARSQHLKHELFGATSRNSLSMRRFTAGIAAALTLAIGATLVAHSGTKHNPPPIASQSTDATIVLAAARTAVAQADALIVHSVEYQTTKKDNTTSKTEVWYDTQVRNNWRHDMYKFDGSIQTRASEHQDGESFQFRVVDFQKKTVMERPTLETRPFESLADLLAPEMFKIVPIYIGDEQLNGVRALHYRGTSESGPSETTDYWFDADTKLPMQMTHDDMFAKSIKVFDTTPRSDSTLANLMPPAPAGFSAIAPPDPETVASTMPVRP